MPPSYSDEDFEKKFWERVDKVSDASGCWLWTGSISNGYGYVRRKQKAKRTHIVSYLLTGNTIPIGFDLAHSENCKNKRHCCNPEHLTPKTRKDNIIDMHRDGTMKQAKLHPEEVLEIRKRLKCGKEQKDIAKDFAVTQSTISRIDLRRTWSHI
jgi:hypothetical protein